MPSRIPALTHRFPYGSREPEPRGEEHVDHERRDDEAERHGQRVHDVGEDRALSQQRHAQVAANEVLDVAHVLHVDRLVEPELMADLYHRSCRRGWPGEKTAGSDGT